MTVFSTYPRSARILFGLTAGVFAILAAVGLLLAVLWGAQ